MASALRAPDDSDTPAAASVKFVNWLEVKPLHALLHLSLFSLNEVTEGASTGGGSSGYQASLQ